MQPDPWRKATQRMRAALYQMLPDWPAPLRGERLAELQMNRTARSAHTLPFPYITPGGPVLWGHERRNSAKRLSDRGLPGKR
jgi:hypothetical protein